MSLLSYLHPLRGATRPCLPFSLSRISSGAHRYLSCGGSANMTFAQGQPVNGGTNGVVSNGNRVGDFLLSQKEAFLGDFKLGNLNGWTVVMGNEAGGEFLYCSTLK